MHNFRELKVWQEAMKFSKEIFSLTRKFPKEEKFGLIPQILRSAVSIPSNIAEGAARDSKKEFNHFLSISLGSCFELETQLILASNFQYIEEERLQVLIEKIGIIQKMIFRLKKSLQTT